MKVGSSCMQGWRISILLLTSSSENIELSEILFYKAGVGQNTALLGSLADSITNSAFLIFTFSDYSAFSFISQPS